VLLLAIGALVAVAATLVLNAFRSNLVFFVTPTQVAAGEVQGRDALRVAGWCSSIRSGVNPAACA